jgi:electron transfer flavoprotein alpha/beta subunit
MRKILVAVKRVIDYNARVRIKPDKVCGLRFTLSDQIIPC